MALLLRKCTVSLSSLTLTRHNYSLPLQTLLFSSSSAKVSLPTADFLTTQHHISPETALKASSTISHLKNPNRIDSILTCLKETGFSVPQIDLVINKYPRILKRNPKIIKKKLKIFQEKGFSTPDTIHIICKNPGVMSRISENRLGSSLTVLRVILGSNEAVCGLLKRYYPFLCRDLSKTMIPNIEYLKKRLKLSSSQVAEYVMRSPELFFIKPETIEDALRRLDEMGLKWSSKMYPHALRLVSTHTENSLEIKMRFFRGLGLSEKEVLQMFKRCPSLFWVSEKNIKETMEVLLGSGRVGPSLFLKNTGMLLLSLEKRIKPRLEVIKALEDKGMWPKKLGLSSILLMSNNKFLETYVLSNSEALGDNLVTRITNKLGGQNP